MGNPMIRYRPNPQSAETEASLSTVIDAAFGGVSGNVITRGTAVWGAGAASAGTGTVTSVSVATANGFAGTVATATSTPAITITTGVTGILLGDGTGVAALTVGSGLDLTAGTLTATGGGTGTVTTVSVATANGVSGTVANATTTPAITLTLGAITPTSVAATGTVTGSNLSGTNTGDQTITLTGAVTGTGTGTFATTLATMATHTILANLTGGTAAPTAATPTQVLDLIDTTQGDILYRGASAWSALGPGTSGQFLKTQGASANPTWADLPATGVSLGGTGASTLTAHAVILGEGASPVGFATIGTAGRPLVDQGSGADPVFSSTGIVIKTHTAPITVNTPGSTVTFNLSLTDWHQITLGQDTTFALSNPSTDQVFYIKIIQGASNWAVTWFTTIVWYTASFAAPTLPATSGKAILCGFRCTGSNTYDGFVVGASGA